MINKVYCLLLQDDTVQTIEIYWYLVTPFKLKKKTCFKPYFDAFLVVRKKQANIKNIAKFFQLMAYLLEVTVARENLRYYTL